MITSPDNSQLKLIRKLQRKKERERAGLFAAEGEDLVEAAAAAGWEPEVLLRAGRGRRAGAARPGELAGLAAAGWSASTGSAGPSRAGELSVYLHGVGDPGNVGAVIRSAHALADGPVMLGPGCADPFGPKAVRASMGSLFARPPARADFAELEGSLVALHAGAGVPLGRRRPEPPVVLCVGAEREGLPAELLSSAAITASIPLRPRRPGVAQRRHGRHRGAVRARE